jgi:HAD superfamily hydrolase (TIGR01484 family)
MLKFRKILLDLDGTVLNRSGMLSPALLTELTNAKDKISISFCTGRTPDFVIGLSRRIGLSTNHVVDDGSRVIDRAGNILWAVRFPREVIDYYVDLADKFHFQISASVNGIEKLNITKNDHDISRLLPYYLNENQVKFLTSHPYSSEYEVKTVWFDKDKGSNVSITHMNGNKKHGIEFLLKYERLNKADVIGVGDEINDLPLFESVGYKVAMGNAPDAVKSVADEVIPPVGKDGLEDFLSKLT